MHIKRFIFVLLFAPAVFAQSIPIQNSSFETYLPLGGWYNYGPIPSWTTTPGTIYAGSFNPGTTYFTSLPDGKIVAEIGNGSISQDLGVTVTPNTNYVLTAWVGHRSDGYTSAYTVTLSAGTNVLATATGNTTDIPAGTFSKVTATYTAPGTPPTGNLVINLAAAGFFAQYDAVSLTSSPVLVASANLAVSGKILWDDNSPVLPGTSFSVNQAINGTPTSIGKISVDGNGNLSGTVAVNPNFTDTNGNITLQLAIAGIPTGVSETIQASEFQQGSTGAAINIVLFHQDKTIAGSTVGPLKSFSFGLTP